MRASKFRALGIGAIAAALATLLIIATVCYRDWKRYETASARIADARRILELNESILDRARDAETGQRGFLLTGAPEYLAPYSESADRMPAELSELAALLRGGSVQEARFLKLQLSG